MRGGLTDGYLGGATYVSLLLMAGSERPSAEADSASQTSSHEQKGFNAANMSSDSLPITKWSSTSQQIMLKKYKELQQPMPYVVRVVDNPVSLHLPDKLMQEDLLLHSIVTHRKAICQCVDTVSKDGQLHFSSQRFSIPLGYTGWLEILSEDGKTISPIKTIELVAETGTDKFLVRSKTKAFLSGNNNDPDFDKVRIAEKGEVMTIVGKLNITHGWRRQKKQLLHCLDSQGQFVYFDFKTTGQFSAIAGTTNISGVHSIEGIINQFRLPLTVRIVSGQIPRVASHNDRPGVFRLLETQKDNTALFLPLLSHQKLMPVSIRTNIRVVQATNMPEIQEYQFYKQLLNLCNIKVEKYFKTMQVLVSAKQQQAEQYSAFTLPSRRKASSTRTQIQRPLDTEEDVLFAEVDDLYAYVRRGGVPPKPRPRSWATNCDDLNVLMSAEGKSSSQPMLVTSATNKSRGLLATLTAGKYPTKTSTLVRQRKTSPPSTPDHPSTPLQASDIPVTRACDRIRSYIEKYHGSMESVQTEVDPYVDEGHYRNSTESLDASKKPPVHMRHPNVNDHRRATRPKTLCTSMEIMKAVSPASSPTDKKGFRSSFGNLVISRSKTQLYPQVNGQSPTLSFIDNAKFQRSVQAT